MDDACDAAVLRPTVAIAVASAALRDASSSCSPWLSPVAVLCQVLSFRTAFCIAVRLSLAACVTEAVTADV